MCGVNWHGFMYWATILRPLKIRKQKLHLSPLSVTHYWPVKGQKWPNHLPKVVLLASNITDLITLKTTGFHWGSIYKHLLRYHPQFSSQRVHFSVTYKIHKETLGTLFRVSSTAFQQTLGNAINAFFLPILQ